MEQFTASGKVGSNPATEPKPAMTETYREPHLLAVGVFSRNGIGRVERRIASIR